MFRRVRTVLRAVRDVPPLDVRAGDVLVVDPVARTLEVQRRERLTPASGFLAGALAVGDVVPLNPDVSVQNLAYAVGAQTGHRMPLDRLPGVPPDAPRPPLPGAPPPESHPTGPVPHLRLVGAAPQAPDASAPA